MVALSRTETPTPPSPPKWWEKPVPPPANGNEPDLLSEYAAITAMQKALDAPGGSRDDTLIAAYDARRDRFFERLEELPNVPENIGLFALGAVLIHQSDWSDHTSLDGHLAAKIEAASTAEPEADAALLAMQPVYEQAKRAFDAAEHARMATGKLYRALRDEQRPEELRLTKGDILRLNLHLDRVGDFAHGRMATAAQKWLDSPQLMNKAARDAYEARAREIVSLVAIDEVREELASVSTGHRDANEREDEILNALNDLEVKILETPATTLRGVRFKSQVAKRALDVTYVGEEWAQQIPYLVLNDILAMGGRS